MQEHDLDLQQELSKIAHTNFFENMGKATLQDESVIRIQSVANAFINPNTAEFKGTYAHVQWLPTSHGETDPFYDLNQKLPETLITSRKQITLALMVAVRHLDVQVFQYEAHDFQLAAKNALYFAFRQALLEQHFQLGQRWENVIQLYYAGHWPIDVSHDQYIVI